MAVDSTIIVAAIAAIPPTLVALLALRTGKKNEASIQQVHLSVNSRMDEMLRLTAASQRAAGKTEERGEQLAREAAAGEPVVTVANLPGTDLPADSRPAGEP
jgi:hypothetical protein